MQAAVASADLIESSFADFAVRFPLLADPEKVTWNY
jgi:hypothetical protein